MNEELKQQVDAALANHNCYCCDGTGETFGDFCCMECNGTGFIPPENAKIVADLWAKVQEQAREIERLKSAKHYVEANPDECVEPDDWPCVSHMAYETLRRTVEAAGWRFNDETDKWEQGHD